MIASHDNGEFCNSCYEKWLSLCEEIKKDNENKNYPKYI